MRIFAAVLAAGLLAAGSATIASSHPSSSGQNAVSVRLKEMRVTASPQTVESGRVLFAARNVGSVIHELVVVRTSRPLPVRGYRAVEPKGASIGEIEDIEPGQAKKVTLTLKPGNYLLLCNVVGHYQLGMSTSLVVR